MVRGHHVYFVLLQDVFFLLNDLINILHLVSIKKYNKRCYNKHCYNKYCTNFIANLFKQQIKYI